MQWLRFGGWPSSHDIDLVLDAEGADYARFEKLAEHLNHETGETILVTALPLPKPLIAAAIAAAEGVPIDAFVSPWPSGFSVAAWSEHPYTVWQVGWAPTLDNHFF